jgi:hypothetical protein
MKEFILNEVFLFVYDNNFIYLEKIIIIFWNLNNINIISILIFNNLINLSKK